MRRGRREGEREGDKRKEGINIRDGGRKWGNEKPWGSCRINKKNCFVLDTNIIINKIESSLLTGKLITILF